MAAATVLDLDPGDAPGSVLAAARAAQERVRAAEVDVLRAALLWADQHPPESLLDTARDADSVQELAGDGAALVSEFCVADLAAVLGLSTDSGRSLIGEALELRDRLPRLFAAVTSLRVPVWRARRIARMTIGLPFDGAAWVDRQLSDHAGTVGVGLLDRLVDEATARFDPDQAARQAEAAADRRQVGFDHAQTDLAGLSEMFATLDLPDALDLDAAVTVGAAALASAGCAEPLGTRRALALGEIARGAAPTLDLNQPADDSATHQAVDHESSEHRGAPPRRPVTLYVHISAAAIASGDPTRLDLARVENCDRTVIAERVAAWLRRAATEVTVKPVIDLSSRIHVRQAEVPDRLVEQVRLRDLTCVFPWCDHRALPPAGERARRWDADHIRPSPEGPTASDNLAPLCRRHHRLKTHGAWRYESPEPGTYVWRNAFGHHYQRDHTGTVAFDPPDV